MLVLVVLPEAQCIRYPVVDPGTCCGASGAHVDEHEARSVPLADPTCPPNLAERSKGVVCGRAAGSSNGSTRRETRVQGVLTV